MPSLELRPDGIAGIVLGPRPARATLVLPLAFAVAAAAHAGIVLSARDGAAPAPPAAAVVAPVLRVDHVVDLERPPPPPARVRWPSPPKAASAPQAAPVDAPPPPAAAGQVIAADDAAAQPVDFTDTTVGAGPGYAGGVTASAGTSLNAVHAAEVDPSSTGGEGAPSRARAVGLPDDDWSCPWPAEAAALAVDEETVLLRVTVRVDGTVAAAALVSDPGYGFGPVALACARAHRFAPALDQGGHAVAATSPPLRLRFVRP